MVYKSSIRLPGSSGTVTSVTGLNTDNTDPNNPIIKISVDGTTITGLGTPASPLVAVGGGGSSAFSAITSGTNTTASMTVGSGALLTYSGTGIVTANNVAVSNEATDTTCFPLFATTATGDQAVKSNTSFTFNSNTGALGATSFSGAGTGLTGTASSLTAGTVTTNANLTGEVTSVGNTTTLTNSAVIAKVITGYVSGAGTISAADSILSAIQKLDGNQAALITGVSSVTATNTTLTISPTTGAVLAGLNLANANTWSALQTFQGGLQSNATTTNSNFAVSGSTTGAGISTTTTSSLLFGGASGVGYRIINAGSANSGLTANQNYASYIIGTQTVTGAASGTHAILAQQAIRPLFYTSGVASVTNTATLYIEGASTATVSGQNYAQWIASGLVRYDGLFNASGTSLTANQIWGANNGATAMEGKTLSGTSNRLTVTNGTGTVTFDIAATYVGQTSITTLGTIGTGIWQGTKIGLAFGGTNADLSSTGGTSQVLKQISSGAAITVGQLAASDLSNGTTGSGAIVLAASPVITTASLGSSTATTQTPGDNSTKLATTAYVQAAIFATDIIGACKYATTTALPTATYNNGSSGVGATLTGVGLGALSIDGVTPSVNDRILVKNQASTFQNGIYVVTVVGSVGAAFVLTRSSDYNVSADIDLGDQVFITAGSTLTNTTWTQNGTQNPVMGTDPITFAQTTGPGSYTSGNGITITGTSIAIDTSVTVDKTTSQALSNKDLTAGTNTFPTFNQNTTGSAAKWTTTRLLAGNSVDGSANVAFANKFIVQGTTDAGLSGAQFLGALGTGIVKNTTSTGILSIAVAADFPTLNQNTTGSAATLTTPRAINGVNFDGSAAITVTAAAGTLTGTTLNATVVSSSLTSVGTLGSLTVTGNINNTALTASSAVATDGSKNLISVTNTGTGNNVLATGPTITGATLTTTSVNGVTLTTGGSTTNFLRADGTYAAPSGSGQTAIQFQDEGSNIGSSGAITTTNFTGTGVTASVVGTTLTVNVPSSGGGSGLTMGQSYALAYGFATTL